MKDSQTPINVYNNPYSGRIMAYLSIFCILSGIALMITSSFIVQMHIFGYMIGGCILSLGSVLAGFSIQSCLSVQSVKYIMIPCCVSEAERKRLEELAKARTPMLGVMGISPVNQQQMQMMICQQQIGTYQYAQPVIVQSSPQTLSNSTITAPTLPEISPVM
ncbi:Hypothetical_protein [Hexamita inflata]|uniref:Hypothetical_protein n=1 Tax=Hexamita inflata TaxID=28002 RepID=A0ABP1GEI3_9EUKA